jgi:hypothetical protein
MQSTVTMSSALVTRRSRAFRSGRVRGRIDITTRRAARDLLVIRMVLRVSERLPLVATNTLGFCWARSATAGSARRAGNATASAAARTGPALIGSRPRTP